MESWLYETDPANRCRYIIGEKGKDPILFIGVNPSKATPEKLDATLTRARKFSKLLGHEGWVMINLYPQRATNPEMIHKRASTLYYQENLVQVKHLVQTIAFRRVCAVWGNLIEYRPYFRRSIIDIVDLIPKNLEWVQLGKPTLLNHPRHPSRLGYNVKGCEFDVENYLKSLE